VVVIFDIDGAHMMVAIFCISSPSGQFAADIVNVIKNGDAYLNVHTATIRTVNPRKLPLTAASQTLRRHRRRRGPTRCQRRAMETAE
jgi:hypothetical protein